MDYKQRALNFQFELYPDAQNYDCDKVLNRAIKKQANGIIHNYAFILHDQDEWTKKDFMAGKCVAGQIGEKKKTHYHLMVSFYNSVSILSCLKHLGLNQAFTPENLTEDRNIVKSYKENCLYYLHAGDKWKDKHRYDIEQLITSDKVMVENLLNNNKLDTLNDYLPMIMEYIDNAKIINIKNIYKFAIGVDKDCLKCVLKANNYRFIKDMIDIHNADWYRERKEIQNEVYN